MLETLEMGHVAFVIVAAIFALDVYLAFFWGKRPKKSEIARRSGVTGAGP